MKTTAGPKRAAVANVATSAELAGANDQRARVRSEILFVDPSVSALETILGNLRPGVEAIVLDSARPAARQIAAALDGRHGLHGAIMAHGAPGRVNFAVGDWSSETLEDLAEDFAAIGRALHADGDLNLWSCRAGAGAEGADFVANLARATGADIAAADRLVRAAALGGGWELETRSPPRPVLPPLTATGVAEYAGVLATVTEDVTVSYTAAAASGVYFLYDQSSGAYVGDIYIPEGSAGRCGRPCGHRYSPSYYW